MCEGENISGGDQAIKPWTTFPMQIQPCGALCMTSCVNKKAKKDAAKNH